MLRLNVFSGSKGSLKGLAKKLSALGAVTVGLTVSTGPVQAQTAVTSIPFAETDDGGGGFTFLPAQPAPSSREKEQQFNPNKPLTALEGLKAYQLVEMARLDAMVKWYQLVYTSLEASRYFADPTGGNEIGNFGVQSAGVVSLVFADAFILRNWVALMRNPAAFQVTPQIARVASQTTRQALVSAAQRFAFAVRNRTIAFAQNSPKLFMGVSTAVVGAIGVAQVGGYYVVNMSEEAYQKLVLATEAELALLRAKKSRLASTVKPVYVP